MGKSLSDDLRVADTARYLSRQLSCRKFRDNAVRLQLHALAYNLANFMRTLALRGSPSFSGKFGA